MKARPIVEGDSTPTTQMQVKSTPVTKVFQDHRPDVLYTVCKPQVALALWNRELPPSLENWVMSLSPDQMPRGRVVASKQEFEPLLEEILDASATPRSDGASLFMSDIVALATLFADIAGTELVDIGLDAIQHDSCWKFHRDQVQLRAITTYCGPGTQYVSVENAERAVREQKAFDGSIYEIPRHTIALFKGAKNTLDNGVVHRSPPITGTGQTRLVLTFNRPGRASPAYPRSQGIQQPSAYV